MGVPWFMIEVLMSPLSMLMQLKLVLSAYCTHTSLFQSCLFLWSSGPRGPPLDIIICWSHVSIFGLPGQTTASRLCIEWTVHWLHLTDTKEYQISVHIRSVNHDCVSIDVTASSVQRGVETKDVCWRCGTSYSTNDFLLVVSLAHQKNIARFLAKSDLHYYIFK